MRPIPCISSSCVYSSLVVYSYFFRIPTLCPGDRRQVNKFNGSMSLGQVLDYYSDSFVDMKGGTDRFRSDNKRLISHFKMVHATDILHRSANDFPHNSSTHFLTSSALSYVERGNGPFFAEHNQCQYHFSICFISQTSDLLSHWIRTQVKIQLCLPSAASSLSRTMKHMVLG